MTLTFEFEEFEIIEEVKKTHTIFNFVMCEVDMDITEPSILEIKPSLNDPGEPPWAAIYEVIEIRLTTDSKKTITLTEDQFITFFMGAQDGINNALEWASEQEPEYEE